MKATRRCGSDGAVVRLTSIGRRTSVLLLALISIPLVPPVATADHEPYYATCVSPVGKDVVLVLDRSSSMLDPEPAGVPLKFTAAKSAAAVLLRGLHPTRDQSALVSFGTDFRLDKGLSFLHTLPQSSTASTEAKLGALVANGATALGGGIHLAKYELDNGRPAPAPNAPYSGNARTGVARIMVLLSDGDQTIHYIDPVYAAALAKAASNVTVYSIALGTAISAPGLAAMRAIATSPAHFYQSPSPTMLAGVFREISARLNDTKAPTLALAIPTGGAYDNMAYRGASPIPGTTAVVGTYRPPFRATDDCRIDRVAFSLDVYRRGTIAAKQDLGTQHVGANAGGNARAFTPTIDCHALPGGRHVLHATVTDWLGKTATTSHAFYCLRAAIDARGTAAQARVTNPAEPRVATRGAALPTSVGGHDAFAVANRNALTPLAYDASALYDAADGRVLVAVPEPNPEVLTATSLSRLANLTLAFLPERYEALESSAYVAVDADLGAGDPLALARLVGARTSNGGHAVRSYSSAIPNQAAATAQAAACTAPAVPPALDGVVDVESCAEVSTIGPAGVTIYRNERIRVTGLGFEEITVNALRVLVERPDLRAEIIFSQAYAGASWLGADALRGPYRALDFEDDAGTGGDVAGTPPAATPVPPGTYAGRVATPVDEDAYAISAVPGEKVHVLLVASNEARARVNGAPANPAGAAAVPALPGQAAATVTPSTYAPSLAIRLLAPDGSVRDAKSTPLGTATSVELNVDQPGKWVAIVSPYGAVGDYTIHASVTAVPMTTANDALRGEDAGATCASALLVGPGAHVGTLELDDAADHYRFALQEGQVLALALRPGDTADAADMDLTLYDPACRLIAYGSLVSAGGLKGGVEVIAFTVPPGASGLYRAAVTYRNGIGTYEIAIAPSVVAVPV